MDGGLLRYPLAAGRAAGLDIVDFVPRFDDFEREVGVVTAAANQRDDVFGLGWLSFMVYPRLT